MSVSRLALKLERVTLSASTSCPRCTRDTHGPFQINRTQSRRALHTSTSKRARLIDAHKQDGSTQSLRAQDRLDAETDAISAAPEIDFSRFKPQAVDTTPPGYIREEEDLEAGGRGGRQRNPAFDASSRVLLTLRVVPASPSYFTAKPRFTDDYVYVMSLLRRHRTLPTVRPGDQPRVQWRDFKAYRGAVEEPVRRAKYGEIVQALKRMNMIHPALMPEEVRDTLQYWAKSYLESKNRPNPIEIDEFGRAAAVGRRKSSSAKAWVVEGNGQVLVNGKPLHQAFARTHDRESVIWALKITQRLDKYNVFGMANGGGTTGQAEALTLAIAKALMAHEPALKTALRKAGCVARDPRRVERKKPGRLKARKKPTWVKR